MSLSLAIKVIARDDTHTTFEFGVAADPTENHRMVGTLRFENDHFDDYVRLLDVGPADARAFHYVRWEAETWTLVYRNDFWFVDCRLHEVGLADRDFAAARAAVVDHLEEHHT